MDAGELRALQAPIKERYREAPGAALVACAGVTLNAVATSLGITLRDASLTAAGDLDFRGKLGVARDVPVGFQAIRLTVTLDTDAADEQVATLMRLTERYCVVYQTLARPASVTVGVQRELLTRGAGPPPSPQSPRWIRLTGIKAPSEPSPAQRSHPTPTPPLPTRDGPPHRTRA
jgi:uncharacterized OsmC-like protein